MPTIETKKETKKNHYSQRTRNIHTHAKNAGIFPLVSRPFANKQVRCSFRHIFCFYFFLCCFFASFVFLFYVGLTRLEATL